MKYLLGLLSFVAVSAFAGTAVESTIAELATSKQYGSFVFIKMKVAPTPIQCSINGYWHFTAPLQTEQDKAIYSTLLAAYMAQKTIRIDGYATGACNEFGSIESMSTITLK